MPFPAMPTQNDTISTISTTVTVEAGATLFFDWDVCCEKIYDNLYFLVDGKEVYELNSEMTARFNGWKTVRYTFRNAGTYTVTWSYVKDEGTSYGDDVGVLDNVTLVSMRVTMGRRNFSACSMSLRALR